MLRNVGEIIRAFLIRDMTAVVLVMTYALANVGTQVLSVAGISALGLTCRGLVVGPSSLPSSPFLPTLVVVSKLTSRSRG